MFKRIINAGFEIAQANKEAFEFWVQQFNLLRETLTVIPGLEGIPLKRGQMNPVYKSIPNPFTRVYYCKWG